LQLGLALLAAPAIGAQAAVVVEVWKDPLCGCCEDWVVLLRQAGFSVKVNDQGNDAARKRLGIPDALGSCHTGSVQGYALEGHVPVKDIRRLLREKPRAVGLAVPGMPVGSPGMDGAVYKGRKDPFNVLLVAKDGSNTVFTAYP
jgi:hypothetical protein